MKTCQPVASTILWFVIKSAHKRLARQTSGSKFLPGPGRCFGLRHVTLSGLPFPVGLATIGRSTTVLPSGARSLPCVLNCDHS
jgi:hypothetical protein